MRRLFFEKFGIRIIVTKSYLGKYKCNIRFRCNKCKQVYFLDGNRMDMDMEIDTVFVVHSDKKVMCKCDDRSPTPEKKIDQCKSYQKIEPQSESE